MPIDKQPLTEAAVININTATAGDLEKLPHIGQQTAQKIVEYRERFGKFRKPEHLLLVRGISVKKFQELKSLVAVE
ncbi:MAG: helix-hairpin-helix domain-containing protein [Acidobacteriota bacterium]|nr:helix-hairpin-helix domain-containing protein [Acidobacteriota bacterium]